MVPVRITVWPSPISRVGPEDHDADIVGFEVERHAAHTGLELDHLAGLDIVEAVDAGDAVANRQHLPTSVDFCFGAEILDFRFRISEFQRADIHQPTSFMRVRME